MISVNVNRNGTPLNVFSESIRQLANESEVGKQIVIRTLTNTLASDKEAARFLQEEITVKEALLKELNPDYHTVLLYKWDNGSKSMELWMTFATWKEGEAAYATAKLLAPDVEFDLTTVSV